MFTYDVFLGHSSRDRPAVRQLAARLERDGLRVAFEDEAAIEQSRVLLLVMSRHALGDDWPKLGSNTFPFRDPGNSERRFVPLLLDDVEIPEALKQFAYVDWRGKSRAQYEILLAVVRTVKPENETTGIREKYVMSAHIGPVLGLVATPDGKRVVSCDDAGILYVWDSGKLTRRLQLRGRFLQAIAVTRDGSRVLCGGFDKALHLWDLNTGRRLLELKGHTATLRAVAFGPNDRTAYSIANDLTARLWDLDTGACLDTMELELNSTNAEPFLIAAISGNGEIAVTTLDQMLYVWDLRRRRCIETLRAHVGKVSSIATSYDGTIAVTGSLDRTVGVWDLRDCSLVARLEGHIEPVTRVAIDEVGRRAISVSLDGALRIWDLDSGSAIGIVNGAHKDAIWGLALVARGAVAITGGGTQDSAIKIWDLSPADPVAVPTETTRYTNAKVLLVGETGSGKTGLAYRLVDNKFRKTISTDAAWATQLKLPQANRNDGIEREVWLWDFAGQADYRLIHQLYMDETALAVLVFNPQSENPFEGIGQWDRDLQRAARRSFQKLLVAGRCDRGGLMVSRQGIDELLEERGFAEYIETSARTGKGCDTLREAITKHIRWETIPWTSSPRVFRLLKEQIVKLKDEGKALLRMSELKQQLELRLPGEPFTIEELRAVVALLAGPGVVWQLEFGDFVLLQPERINAYAGAVIRSVRAHTDEIGAIDEQSVLSGDLDYQKMNRLPEFEEEIVLRAMHQTFIDHGLCLREHTDRGALLVFPSYFKRERPPLEEHPLVIVTYRFHGPLDEVYATLVVRLHHTSMFEKDRLWRFAADFKTATGKRLGLKLNKLGEGRGELEIYFEPGITDDVQVTFIRYVHEHLQVKAENVERIRQYVCGACGKPTGDRQAVQDAKADGRSAVFCSRCGKPVPLHDLIEEKFASEEFQRRARELDEEARKSIDNESRELILVGHAYSITGEAGHIYRQYTNSDHGIDGEIEFKDYDGKASGRRLYLQLKSGDSYLSTRKRDGAEVFTIKNPRHADYWRKQEYPVMLVVRTSDGTIRWMDVSAYLKRESASRKTQVKQVIFEGEPFTALTVSRWRDEMLASVH